MAVYPNLLNARTTNGAGTAQTLKRARESRTEGSLFVWGVFDGATVTIQDSIDGTKWFDIPSGAFTVAGTASTDFRRQLQTSAQYIRASVASVTGNTSVSAHFE